MKDRSIRPLPTTPLPAVAMLLTILAPLGVQAQFIDFETLPGGGATVDLQEITTEYAAYGVTFTLLSRETGLPIGGPRIAKAGPPRTAFQGCFADDTPRPHIDLGVSFLTDGTEVALEGDLLIEYATPVAQATGVILDIDCRDNGGPPCEQWTVTAFDESGNPLDSVVLDAPAGAPNPECEFPEAGPGDSEAFGWTIDVGTEQIKSIILRYTGTATVVGLAFDSFSVAGEPDPPTVTVVSPVDTVCVGESTVLDAVVLGGLPPFAFQWQRQLSPTTWIDLGTDPSQPVLLLESGRYQVTVSDALAHEVTSAPVEIFVAAGHPLCQASLLVSSFDNDRVVRYSFLSHQASVFVPTGSGGLNGPAELICRAGGDLLVGSQVNDSVRRYRAANGDYIETFVASGSGGLDIPVGLAIGPDEDLYVTSYTGHEVLRYDGNDGSFIDIFIPYGSGLNGPTDLVFGPDGDLYVCSYIGDKVMRFDGTTADPLGEFVTVGSGGLNTPRGLEFGPDGNLYIAEEINDSVRRYDGDTGAFIDVFVPTGSGGLDRANDLAFGPDGVLYVASFNGQQVLRFDGTSGAFLGPLPNDHLNHPAWLEIGCVPLATAAPDLEPAVSRLTVEPGVPNPFNPRTTVAFTIEAAGWTRVRIVDPAGRVVATLLDRQLGQGRHAVAWDGRGADGRAAPSGVYVVSVESGRSRASGKLVLLR